MFLLQKIRESPNRSGKETQKSSILLDYSQKYSKGSQLTTLRTLPNNSALKMNFNIKIVFPVSKNFQRNNICKFIQPKNLLLAKPFLSQKTSQKISQKPTVATLKLFFFLKIFQKIHSKSKKNGVMERKVISSIEQNLSCSALFILTVL